jgi:V/A-type H+/Na+-transporting ATPase subunit A
MTPAGSGQVRRVSGPLVEADGLADAAMLDVAELGPNRLPGEIVALDGDRAMIQAYEYTGGLMPGDVAVSRREPLTAPLGPHLLGGVFDGLLRPLSGAGMWLSPGSTGQVAERSWGFSPVVRQGALVVPGAVLGKIDSDSGIDQLVLVPAGVNGEVTAIRRPGRYPADAPVATVAGAEIRLVSHWPVRRPRPYRDRLDDVVPLITGQRVVDLLLPVPAGGTAAVPGGFGTGKTVLLQQIAKWCKADVIVYVGCGERGNELAEIVAELAELSDPRTGGRLADRTVVIANTSNMPMMARETSIYSAVTVAEYFRDMGLDAVVIADSTSRWAEALREFASRSGALPAEEGYPADLASSLAAFYERAARVRTLDGATGSVTIIGAVSPAGGDMTEPVTTHTQRFVRCLWTLDRDLAYARHYPAISWRESFARDVAAMGRWHTHRGDARWADRRARVASALAEADRVKELADLVGLSGLPGRERIALLAGRLIREGFLQQNALSPVDAFCDLARTAALADAVLAVVDQCQALVDQGVLVSAIEEHDFSPVLRAREDADPQRDGAIRERCDAVITALQGLR